MFDPKVTFPIKTLWDKLGTFYSRMTPEGRKVVEKYWDALFRGMEGLYYDLYQVNLSSYLETSPGYLEHAYQDHSIVFEGVAKNTELLPQLSGSYYFDLPDEGIYLSIPTLSGKTTGQVLHEGVDYEIHNFKRIKFLKDLHISSRGVGSKRINVGSRVPFSTNEKSIKTDLNNLPHSISEEYLAKTAITLVPSLTNFIIPSFGREEPQIFLESGYYEPYTSGWRSGSLSYLEQRKQWAQHLTKWSQGMIACFAKAPTLKNLEQSYALVRGFPFAKRQGVVSKIEKGTGVDNQWDYITISVDENTNAYIALGATWDTQIITQSKGNFLRVYSKGKPPTSQSSIPSNAAVENNLDFWFPLKPREANEASKLPEGVIGIHNNGVPFVGIPNDSGLLTQNLDHGWVKNHMFGTMKNNLGIDQYNGSVDSNNHYYYAGKPVGSYQEMAGTHSPLIGYALDGFPIYGSQGYVNKDGSGGVTTMTSSYQLIKGEARPAFVGGGLHDGTYRNDFEYVADLGTLDENNGRFAATPEYPDGIYHYHVTTEFPYLLNGFAGVPSYNTSALPTIGISEIEQAVTDVYEIPTGGGYNFSVGDPISKFDILLSGIQFIDYVIDPDLIDSIVTASGTNQTFEVHVSEDYEFKKGFSLNGLSEYIIFTGSYLQNADVNYVDLFDDQGYKGVVRREEEILSLSGMDGTSNHLYNHNPGTFDPALPTQDSIYQSFDGLSSIDPSVEGTIEGTDIISGTYTSERPTAVPRRGGKLPGPGLGDDDNDINNTGGSSGGGGTSY